MHYNLQRRFYNCFIFNRPNHAIKYLSARKDYISFKTFYLGQSEKSTENDQSFATYSWIAAKFLAFYRKFPYLMVIFFKVVFRNEISIKLQIKNIILAVNVPSHCKMMNVSSFFLRTMRWSNFSFVSSMVQLRIDNLVTLKNVKNMNKLVVLLICYLFVWFIGFISISISIWKPNKVSDFQTTPDNSGSKHLHKILASSIYRGQRWGRGGSLW